LSDYILKGKGVYYRDAEGVMHPQSFPPEDSDHENISHFHINSKTGQPFAELEGKGLVGKFPVEIAAEILARELMTQGYTDETGAKRKPVSMQSALRLSKTLFNNATKRFNDIKRKAGDDFHILPMKFDDNGILNDAYKNNHYGGHQPRRVSTAQRKTRTTDGKVINNHPRNEAHPELGQHLESAALHIADELRDEAERIGVQTELAAGQNVLEPQQITDGITHRYTSNDADPTSKENTKYPNHYKDLHAQTAAYGQISPMDIVSVLPSDFFVPSTSGGMSTNIMNQLIERGYDQPTARSMARAPVNQLLYGRGKDGSQTGLNKVVRNMRAKLGIDTNDDIHAMFKNHRDNFAPLIRGGDRGRNHKAIEIMAMLKLAEQMGVDPSQYSMYPSAPSSVMNGWRDVAIDEGGKQIDMAALGSVDEGHQMRGKFSNQFDHMYDSFPDHLSGGSLADALPAQPVVVEEPMSDPPPPVTTQEPLPQPPVAQPIDFGFRDLSQFNPFPSGRTFTMSDDDPMGVIATIMERVQMHDAGGSLLVKYDPMDNYDMHKLGQNVGMSSIDVRAIAMSLGDWGVIAKSFNTTHDVVRAIKRSCGGALNG
tara:strand:+ start:12436 stop:14226 length:1791 start_codon:yes stop_codon:yes gene_type:complete